MEITIQMDELLLLRWIGNAAEGPPVGCGILFGERFLL